MCQKIRRPIIIFLSLLILTLNFLTYLGLYTILNNMTRPVQSVTVSSEGPAAEMYPDGLGQYNILRDVYRFDRAVYRHVDRDYWRNEIFIVYTGRNTYLYEKFSVTSCNFERGEGGQKGENLYLAFLDELDHFKHKLKSVYLN